MEAARYNARTAINHKGKSAPLDCPTFLWPAVKPAGTRTWMGKSKKAESALQSIPLSHCILTLLACLFIDGDSLESTLSVLAMMLTQFSTRTCSTSVGPCGQSQPTRVPSLPPSLPTTPIHRRLALFFDNLVSAFPASTERGRERGGGAGDRRQARSALD